MYVQLCKACGRTFEAFAHYAGSQDFCPSCKASSIYLKNPRSRVSKPNILSPFCTLTAHHELETKYTQLLFDYMELVEAYKKLTQNDTISDKDV